MEFVCLSVCLSILAPGGQTAGPIGTGEAPFDAPERRKDDGANSGAIGGKWHVKPAIWQTYKNLLTGLQSSQWTDTTQTLWADRWVCLMGVLDPLW